MGQHILIIGGGAREHVLAWKLSQSPRVSKISVAPGNGGTPNNVPIAASDIDGLLTWAKANQPDLTVVGPEDPLSMGIVDAFQAAGLRVFGPGKAAAQIEASKIFSKQFMARHRIPTAAFEVFTDPRQAIGYLLTEGDRKLAIKADGLAAGKGVYVTDCGHDAEAAVNALMVEHVMGNAGSRIIIEHGLEGSEMSLMVFSDGKTVAPMLLSQDHKRVFDADQGPNTGGMGAYTLADGLYDIPALVKTMVQPAIDGLRNEGTPFVGILFAGLMATADGIYVLEYNGRFGDPETEVVLPLLKTDLLDVFEACLDGRLNQIQLDWQAGTAATVVMASGGYPGSYDKGKPISGLENVPPDVTVFHAGTKRQGDQVVTAGGRVLAVTSTGADLPSALDRAYAGVQAIQFDGAHYRHDIGARALRGTNKG